jgi:hypothetical protein
MAAWDAGESGFTPLGVVDGISRGWNNGWEMKKQRFAVSASKPLKTSYL